MQSERSLIEDGPEGEWECECGCTLCLEGVHCQRMNSACLPEEDDYEDSDEARWEDQDRGLDDD